MASESMPSAQLEALRAARRAHQSGDFSDAARMYARIVAEDGKCGEGWYGLGNARWRRGDRDGAIEAWRRAVAEDPGRARAWQNLAAAWVATEQWVGAVEAAQKAVSLDPGRAKAWNTLGVARIGLNETKGAEVAFRRAVETDPSLVVARTNLGHLLLREGRCEEAARALAGAVAEGDGAPETRLALARCHEARGETHTAETVLEEAATAAPTHSGLWTALGDARRARGDDAGALAAYEGAWAAVVDLGDVARARVARRRAIAALSVAREAVVRGERREFLAAVTQVRAAAEDAAAAGDASDPAAAAEAMRCVTAAREAGQGDFMPAWVEEVVLNALWGRMRPAAGSAP